MRLWIALWTMMTALLVSALPAGTTEAGWALLREGEHVVLLRHAIAPGAADPANFDIAACSTQRNLSDRGRQQARKLGALFAARAAPTEIVLSSRYCRTRDTARLAFGSFEDFSPLDPPSTEETARKEQLSEIVQRVRDYTGSGNMVMVTHLETIQALTGAGAREGEAVIVSAGDDLALRVLARIVFN